MIFYFQGAKIELTVIVPLLLFNCFIFVSIVMFLPETGNHFIFTLYQVERVKQPIRLMKITSVLTVIVCISENLHVCN